MRGIVIVTPIVFLQGISQDPIQRHGTQFLLFLFESNAIIQEIAAERGLEYIDLYSIYIKRPELFRADGVHLDKDKSGYGPWVDRIRGLVYNEFHTEVLVH